MPLKKRGCQRAGFTSWLKDIFSALGGGFCGGLWPAILRKICFFLIIKDKYI
jgi:hypothetical protein